MYLRSSISMIGITLGLSFSVLAQPPDRTLTCSSADGRRTVCEADTRNGVLLSRQLGSVRCVEGYNWGYSEEGIWVNRGCQAEFVVQGRERPRNWERNTRLEAGTIIPVRVDQSITSERADGRIFTGVVDQDVVGTNGRLAIPRGSNVELIVRAARDGDLILDLESVVVVGQRYALDAQVERVESTRSGGVNRRTGEFAGGGAVLGAIIGAIAGGGKGAAIGAGAGAAAGLTTDVVTRGKRVRIPAESVLTFRLDSGLVMGVADSGTIRDGWHYHNEPKQ
jgi:hypothetical protein